MHQFPIPRAMDQTSPLHTQTRLTKHWREIYACFFCVQAERIPSVTLALLLIINATFGPNSQKLKNIFKFQLELPRQPQCIDRMSARQTVAFTHSYRANQVPAGHIRKETTSEGQKRQCNAKKRQLCGKGGEEGHKTGIPSAIVLAGNRYQSKNRGSYS